MGCGCAARRRFRGAGQIEAVGDSRYPAEDVTTLAKRKQVDRTHETRAINTMIGTEPSISIPLSTFVREQLY